MFVLCTVVMPRCIDYAAERRCHALAISCACSGPMYALTAEESLYELISASIPPSRSCHLWLKS